jgi:CTP synthase
VDHIYEVPLKFHEEGLDQKVVELLNIWTRAPRLDGWISFVDGVKSLKNEVTIGIVGKYVDLRESYKSLNEALFAGGVHNSAKVNLKFIDSEAIEKQGISDELFQDVDGILVPGGFGSRGIEGKIRAVQYARENLVPYFGICLGMQMAVVEFSRNVCDMARANSTEFDPNSPYPVIDLMAEQRTITDKGGTMRLGTYECVITPNSKCSEIYGAAVIHERHRHRYEFNSSYREVLEAKGLKAGGLSPDGKLVELVEYADHPWFVGCQFHPEFKSKPMDPHPLFASYIAACLENKNKKLGKSEPFKGRRLGIAGDERDRVPDPA